MTEPFEILARQPMDFTQVIPVAGCVQGLGEKNSGAGGVGIVESRSGRG
ncbi:hypothetical protein ACFS4T_16000 [Pseudomonas lini]